MSRTVSVGRNREAVVYYNSCKAGIETAVLPPEVPVGIPATIKSVDIPFVTMSQRPNGTDSPFPSARKRPNERIYPFPQRGNDQMNRFTFSLSEGMTKWTDLPFPQPAESPNGRIYSFRNLRNQQMDGFTLFAARGYELKMDTHFKT